MKSNMGSITQLAYSAITNEQRLLEQYSRPEDVLNYLQNEKNFKSLSSLLKETMVKAGLCDELDPQSRFINELYSRLDKQDDDCGNEEKRSIATIRRWISGRTPSFRYRDSAIEICFALNLNLDLSADFLNKCGFNSFNVRNAKDATYLYCIINNRPLFVAKNIISKYLNHAGDFNEDKNPISYTHSGNTTIILETTLGNSSWESDDDFLNTYLIPNKIKFIGYTTTAVNEYYKLKNDLWFTVISDAISNELTSIKVFSIVDECIPSSKTTNDFFPIIIAMQSALNKNNNENSILYDAYKIYNKDIHNIKNVLSTIKNIINTKTDIESRKQISTFLTDIIKVEGLLKRTVECLLNNKDRLRGINESSLNSSVMKEFPYDNTFALFEKDPGSDTINEGMSFRKAIILMYYIAYAYEFSTYLSDETYNSELFGELGFVEFLDGLNRTLSMCHLPTVYPANQFDWLILRSIREFEISDYADEDGNPIAFFNDVLAFSFPDSSEEDN